MLVAHLQVAHKVNPARVAFPFVSALTLMTGAVFWLVLLSAINAGLKRWLPRFAIRPSEMAVIYGLTTVAASIGSQDAAMELLPMYVYPFRATQEGLMGPFRQFIQPWLAPQDPAIVEPYYLGQVSFWTPERMWAWAMPLLTWMVWLFVLGLTMWAWNVILRRRWMDQDRLTFPCVQLPLELCRSGGFGGLASGKLFWGGAGVATLLVSLKELHARFPVIPEIPLLFNLSPALDASPAPWNALSPMWANWDLISIGACYFIPLDILLSAWVFMLGRKGMEIFGFMQGWRNLGWDAAGFPYTRSQAAGAWIGLFFLLVWAERHHLRRVLIAAFGGRANFDDEREPGSYRVAGRLLVGGTLFLIAFGIWSGMSPWLTIAFYAFFWMLFITMTRIYAQVGPPILELYFLDPQKTLTTIFGTVGQAPGSLTNFSLMYWINRTSRGHPMAHMLSAFYVGRATRVEPRSLGRWVLVAFVVGCAACLLSQVHFAYRVGEDMFVEGGWREAFAPQAVARINEWVKSPKGPNWTEISFIGIGATITLALAALGNVVIGFPLHPIGYAMAMCFTVEYNWAAFLLLWAVKGLSLRYGGRNAYQRFAPFFLGITLGGFVAPVLWGLIAFTLRWYP